MSVRFARSGSYPALSPLHRLSIRLAAPPLPFNHKYREYSLPGRLLNCRK